MSDHLSTQGRLDPKGGLCYFWCPNKTRIPLIDASGELKIVKNRSELRKLQPPKVEGVKNSEKHATEHYKA